MIGEGLVPAALSDSTRHYFGPAGAAWAATLPRRVEELAARWSLRLGRVLPGRTSFVALARRRDGTEAVLRVGFPERGVGDAAAALAHWGGEGAVELLAAAPEHRASLLERCRPGRHLSELALAGEEAIEIAASLVRRLWRPDPGGGFARLAALAGERAELAERRLAAAAFLTPAERHLARYGIALLAEPPPTAEGLLLHGDLHPRNVLSSWREPWLAIDPRPLVGDPAFDLVPLVLEAGGMERAGAATLAFEVPRRVRRAGAIAAVDPGAIALWGVARRVDWAMWLADRGDPSGCRRALVSAGAFAGA